MIYNTTITIVDTIHREMSFYTKPKDRKYSKENIVRKFTFEGRN